MSLGVLRALGLVTVQDLGRPGRMHEALAPGGALVPELLVAANRAVRNPDNAPAIEVLGRLAVRAESAIVTSVRALAAGEELVVTSEPARVVYLAIRGGVAAPLVLGGRATQLSAGLGAPLRTGDRIDSADLPTTDTSHAGITRDVPGSEPRTSRADPGITREVPGSEPRTSRADPGITREVLGSEPRTSRADPGITREVPGSEPRTSRADPGIVVIRVLPGPDVEAFDRDALVRFAAEPYRILPTSDRVGTRLEGAAIAARAGGVSRPMVRGAIEIPPDGQPIVLGPEHPTTGGYPVLAVVAHADLGWFFATRIGARVRFEIGDNPSR